MECLEFSSGVIAASALYHFSSCELATHVSGYEYKDLAKCIHWMAAFAGTVRDVGLQEIKQFPKVDESDAHNIQTHANDIAALVCLFIFSILSFLSHLIIDQISLRTACTRNVTSIGLPVPRPLK